MSDRFAFTYSAEQQEEIRRIRQKYVTGEDKLGRLRRLDANVTRKGTVAAMILGILGTLVLGIGMSCCMVWGGDLFIPGILIGLVGIGGVALAYPVYDRVTARERQRLAPEILRLTDELIQ